MRKMSFTMAAATLLLGVASRPGAQAADIAVLAAAALEEPFEAVVHAVERDSGNKVTVSFGSVGALSAKLKAADKAHLVISSTAALAAAEQDGPGRPGSRALLRPA